MARSKRILMAFLEQVIQFNSDIDYRSYIKDLERGKTKYRIKNVEKDATGQVYVTVRKQYNNVPFPG